MSIATVVTRGFGTGASISFVTTRGFGNYGTVTRNPYYSEFSEFRIPDTDSGDFVEFKMVNQLNAQDAQDIVYILTAIVDKLDD